jgi:hypothetical protein
MNVLALRGRGTGAMIQDHPLGRDRKIATDPDGAVDKYLQKELKIDLYKQQQSSLVEALKTPDAWLGKRETCYEKINSRVISYLL